MKKYIVRLSTGDRDQIKELLTGGRGPVRMFTRARILLKADQSGYGPAWSDKKISEAFDVTVLTVQRIRKQLVKEGFDAVLSRRECQLKKPRRKIDGDLEAHLFALACSKAPEGRSRWTLRLLADSFVELGYVDGISRETVRHTLKKTKLSLGGSSSGAFHRKPTRRLVCAMEDILTLYKLPYDPDVPLICMDETSKQLTKETRQ